MLKGFISDAKFVLQYNKHKIKVPKIFWEQTSKKVLCLDKIDGVSIREVEKLKSLNIDIKKLSKDIISGESALTSEPASTDEFLVSDAGTLKRIDYSLISNRPAFNVYGGAASVSNNTYTKLAVSTERFDIGSCFDLGSNDRFTPDVSGKYLLYLKAEIQSGNDTDYFVGNIYKNGSSGQAGAMVQRDYNIMTFMQLAEANGSGDYFEAYAKQQSGGSVNIVLLEFSGFKLIGV